MGSWIAGFAPEGGTQHDAEITLRVGDASVGRTQFPIGKLSKFQTKMTHKSPKNQSKNTVPERLGAVMGASWGRLGRHGAVLGRLGAFLGRLGAFWGPSWAVLEPSWGVLGRLGAVL